MVFFFKQMSTSVSLEHMTVLQTLPPAQIHTGHTAVLVTLATWEMEKKTVKL